MGMQHNFVSLAVYKLKIKHVFQDTIRFFVNLDVIIIQCPLVVV